MSLVVLLVLMLSAAALPDLMPHVLSIHRHPPDLWALAVLYIAFRARGFRAVGWAIAIGAIRDCVSLDPLGANAFVLGCTAFFFCEGRSSRGRIEGPTRVALTGLGVLLAGWIYLLRILPLGGGVVNFEAFVSAVPVALWSAVLAGGLFALLDRYRLLDEVCGRTHAFPA